MSSTACLIWDARTTSAWPNPGPGWGHCARIPDPCNTAPSAGARPRHPQRPPGAQAGGQLAAQRPPALHVQRLVDGFMADAHGLIIGKVEPQAAGDLVRAPG